MIANIQEKSDRSISAMSFLDACIERFKRDIDLNQQRLEEISSVKFYTAKIKKDKAKAESNIAFLTNTIAEIKLMQSIPLGSWVKNDSNTPGKVIELRVVGSVPEVQVQWWGSTVPIPERPRKLTLVDDYQMEYIWNGDRYPKLVRRLDLWECDEIEVLNKLLGQLAVDKHHASDEIIGDYKTKQTYLRKRVSWINQQDLERLERVVRQGLEIFYRVGEALAEIRDRKLYKDLGYSNFRDYLMERWNMKKSHAYRLIDSGEVVKNLSPEKISLQKSVPHGGQNESIAYQSDTEPSEIVIPQSERVAREIGKVPKERQPEAWQKTIERFGNNPTAKEVKEVVAEGVNCPDKETTVQISCPDKQSTVQISCPDKEVTGNQKLAEQFEIGQLVKLQLSNFEGVSENLKLANHSYGQITALTESKCSFDVKVFSHKSFVVSPQDLKPVDSVRCCVEFSTEEFLALMNKHQTKIGIEDAMKKGVLNDGSWR